MFGFLQSLRTIFGAKKSETPGGAFACEGSEAPPERHEAQPEPEPAPAHSPGMLARRESLTREIDAVEWSAFKTAYGKAGTVPADLKSLMFGSEEQAMEASHELWCGLCHQHAYMSSAAEPALPFLLIALSESKEPLQVEILDILVGFAILRDEEHPFTLRVFNSLSEQRASFAVLLQSANKRIARFAERICEALDH